MTRSTRKEQRIKKGGVKGKKKKRDRRCNVYFYSTLVLLERRDRQKGKSYTHRQRKWEEENIWKVSGTSLPVCWVKMASA